MTAANTTSAETETWEAWLDGKRDAAVTFEVPLGGTYDVVGAGADALGIDVSEDLNVQRVLRLNLMGSPLRKQDLDYFSIAAIAQAGLMT